MKEEKENSLKEISTKIEETKESVDEKEELPLQNITLKKASSIGKINKAKLKKKRSEKSKSLKRRHNSEVDQLNSSLLSLVEILPSDTSK